MNNAQDAVAVEAASESTTLNVSGALDSSQALTQLKFEDGSVVRIPTDLLITLSRGAGQQMGVDLSEDLLVPVVEEHLQIGKRTVPTGTVRIQKTTEEHPETVNEVLATTTFEVERVPVDRLVPAAPPVRTEGETIIYPVCEEHLVISKSLVLREEVRVTRRRVERSEAQTITLLRERVTVERDGPETRT